MPDFEIDSHATARPKGFECAWASTTRPRWRIRMRKGVCPLCRRASKNRREKAVCRMRLKHEKAAGDRVMDI